MKSCSYTECKPCHDETYERKHIERLQDYLFERVDKLSEAFIDVGAHTGLWSLAVNAFYDAVGVKSSSVAFEADVENCQILSQNLQDKNILIINSALWNKEIVLGWNRCSHPARRRVIPSSVALNADYYVQANPLDRLMSSSADAIKIDVEGAELQVLQGAEVFIKTHAPLLIIEVCNAHYKNYGYDKTELKEYLKSLEYDFYSEEDKTLFAIEDDSSAQVVFFSKEKINE